MGRRFSTGCSAAQARQNNALIPRNPCLAYIRRTDTAGKVLYEKHRRAMMFFRGLHPTTRRLLLARSLRSIGQGALVVDFALYLHTPHWSGADIGFILGGSGLAGAVFGLLVGISSDRIRRKPFLLVYETLSVLAGTGAMLTADVMVLAVAAIAGQFGRGAMGAAGPFAPAEQAWLAEEVLPERRGWVYSLNAALGFWGMALGASIAVLPHFWQNWLPGSLAYRPLFGLVSVMSVANIILLSRAGERCRKTSTIDERHEPNDKDRQIRRRENLLMAKLVLINSFNGFAIGLTGPLISTDSIAFTVAGISSSVRPQSR